MKKAIKIIGIIVVAIAVLFFGYLNVNQYSASDEAIATINTTATYQDSYYEIDHNSDTGIIFYPGAKVYPEAYAYLGDIDEANIYIAKFPYNFAFFNPNIAQSIIENNPDVDNWYMSGHSLGGVFAYNYANNHLDQITGVIFLASYPTKKIEEDNPLEVLSLYGSDDGVVGDYTEKLSLFNSKSQLIEIEGANHGQCGDYGFQKGDNEVAISSDEQHKRITDEIEKFI